MCGSARLLLREGKRHEVAENESKLSGEAEPVCRAVLRAVIMMCSDSSSAGCCVFSAGPSPQCHQGKASVEVYLQFMKVFAREKNSNYLKNTENLRRKDFHHG